MDSLARELRHRLEHGQATADEAVEVLSAAALDAPTRTARLAACRLLGELAGRGLGADWEFAEQAAFSLLEAARVADTAADRRGVIAAMGRGFRNIWLLPFVHRRLSDRDESIAIAAIEAAGGLGFPALEEAVAAFVGENIAPTLRLTAIAALGRMGATNVATRIAPYVLSEPQEAAAAFAALTEIRSPIARDAALAALADELEPEVQIASVRYLAELGALEILPVLRRLARDERVELRLAASQASRALKAERDRDAGERFLVALGEPDRAVRAVLARRLRSLPVPEVLEHAEVLLGEDAAGVIQVIGEVHEPEVTKYLIELAGRAALPVAVRARAIGTIEADQPWEREALAAIAHRCDADDALRAAAVQALGAFATRRELVDTLGELAHAEAPSLRAALLWALQLARADGDDRAAIAKLIEPLLEDSVAAVRRRAIYAAGNLGLETLASALARRCAHTEAPDLRLAAYVALGELGMPGVVPEVVAAVKREEDPRALGAASNALIAVAPEPAALAPLAARATQLLGSPDAKLREAGAEIAGLLGGAVPAAVLEPLASDRSATVRGAAVWALGKLADPSSERALLAAFRDDDATVQERAAAGLLRLGTAGALAQAIAFVAGDSDALARGALASALHVPPAHAAQLASAIDDALAKVGVQDPAFEPLLRLKLAAALAQPSAAAAVDVDGEITAAFPAFAQLTKLAGFDSLVKSLRTAESLFQNTNSQANADLSPPITLWMKVLENYVHAWLGPRLQSLQREPAALFDYVDRVIGGSWGGYQRWIEPKWRDPMEVGGARVDIPLRAIPNAARELQEHRRKRLDSPLSVTEWARMLVLFAVDHPATGFRNLMRLGKSSSAEKTIALAHRLHALAAVRNLVTHRASAGATTVAAFRRVYYAAFEELVSLA